MAKAATAKKATASKAKAKPASKSATGKTKPIKYADKSAGRAIGWVAAMYRRRRAKSLKPKQWHRVYPRLQPFRLSTCPCGRLRWSFRVCLSKA